MFFAWHDFASLDSHATTGHGFSMQTTLRTLAHLSALLALAASGAGCKEAQARTKGVGDSLQPFIVMNCESGDRYCQICAYGGKPKIMVVADMDDAKVEADLMRVQKLVDAHQAQGLVAFALFGEIENGAFKPVADDAAAAMKLKEMRERLKLTYPVTLVPSSYTERETKGYTPFISSYEIPTSRRVLFADISNRIKFAETIQDAQADAQFARLDAELAKL